MANRVAGRGRVRTRPQDPVSVLDAVAGHPALADVAGQWLRAVCAIRKQLRLYGRVTTFIVDTPDGVELHLHEETTFKGPGPGSLAGALEWLRTQAARRVSMGLSGGGTLEFRDADGEVTFARVTEETVVTEAAAAALLAGEIAG